MTPGLSRDQILSIIDQQGYFSVNIYSWGARNTRKKLGKMRKEGLVKIKERVWKSLIYVRADGEPVK